MQHNHENTQQGIHTLNEMVTEILPVKALADQDPYADKDRKETTGHTTSNKVTAHFGSVTLSQINLQ